MTDLHLRHCQPVGIEAAMSPDEIERHLAFVPEWRLVDGALERRYDFADFHDTMAFVNALAWVAHRQDHHPDVQFGYNRCVVRYNTHSAKGISLNDFICAARLEALGG